MITKSGVKQHGPTIPQPSDPPSHKGTSDYHAMLPHAPTPIPAHPALHENIRMQHGFPGAQSILCQHTCSRSHAGCRPDGPVLRCTAGCRSASATSGPCTCRLAATAAAASHESHQPHPCRQQAVHRQPASVTCLLEARPNKCPLVATSDVILAIMPLCRPLTAADKPCNSKATPRHALRQYASCCSLHAQSDALHNQMHCTITCTINLAPLAA
jgi:hypothetical protein